MGGVIINMAFVITLSIIVIFISILFLLSLLFYSKSNTFLDLLSPYECGLEPIGNTKIKFEIIYYLIAILYLIFDLELLFLFPFIIIFNQLNNFISLSLALIFFLILTIGFLYEMQKNAFDF